MLCSPVLSAAQRATVATHVFFTCKGNSTRPCDHQILFQSRSVHRTEMGSWKKVDNLPSVNQVVQRCNLLWLAPAEWMALPAVITARTFSDVITARTFSDVPTISALGSLMMSPHTEVARCSLCRTV